MHGGPVWKERLAQAVEAQSIPDLVLLLDERSTAHAHTPPASIKNQVIRALQTRLRHDKTALYRMGVSLATWANWAANEIGAAIITEFWGQYPLEIEPIFRRLADSENWEVREWAASACGEVLAGHHDFYHVLASWTRHASANVRRAVAIAAMYAGKTRNPDNAEPLLRLIEPLLIDANPYVKRNLGPFALGSGLLRYYPTETLTRIDEWSRHPEAQARWNVAMVFTAAEGAKHIQAAKTILARLENDPSKSVRSAVRQAVKAVHKRSGCRLSEPANDC